MDAHPARVFANQPRAYQPPTDSQQTQAPPPKADPYHGHADVARLCARFISHLFACPEYPPTSNHAQTRLPYFIAYALHRTKLHPSVTFAALILLQRLKARFPTARGSSGHRLFISAFMIASKVICDDTYSNKSWSIVAQNLFSLREVNQMEREMCNYLDWELNVDHPMLKTFEAAVRKDFAAPQGPYPTYSPQMVSKHIIKPASSTTTSPAPPTNSTTSPIPLFGNNQRGASPAKPQPSATRPRASPATTDTPSPSYSSSSSPASSASPPTPPGTEDFAKIHEDSKGFGITSGSLLDAHPLKAKMFALAVPTVW